MSDESIFRAAAVVAAVALLVAPYRQAISRYVAAATEAAKQHRATIARFAAAALLIAAAWGKVTLPRLPASAPVVINVEEPSVEMQQLVSPIASAISSLPISDRMLWANVWSKAAIVAAGDAVSAEVVFTDTRSLRLFTVLSLDIAWRRIGQHAPGSVPGLRDAVEAAYNTALGLDVLPVDKTVRDRYVEFCKAVAWAGVNKG